MTLVLGLDIGSTTTKAALVDAADEVRVVHVARQPTPATVDELVVAAATLAHECAAHASSPIVAVGIASMAESGAALDASGLALTPLLRWDRDVDRRHLETLLAQHPDLPAATGVPATTKPTAVALTALRAEQPDVFDAMRHWTGVADLVAHTLTGERATDHTLATRSMLAGWRGEEWDVEVLQSLDVHSSVLSELRVPGEPVGVTAGTAAEFGLGTGIPVHIAGHDHAVGAWAAGSRAPGDAADSLGTAEAVVRIASDIDSAQAVEAGFSVGRTVDGAWSTILGGSSACGAMLSWWDAENGVAAGRTLGLLAASRPHTWVPGSAIVLPYPSGRQCPAPDASARVRTIGDAGDESDGARSVLQSLVAQARWMREAADGFAGSTSTALTLVGSLAERVPAWAPLMAAAGIPTRVCTTAEPVAAGAALLAAVRAGEAPSDLTLTCAAVDPVEAAAVDDIYRRFLMAVTAEGES